MRLLTIHHITCPSATDFCHGIEGELAVAFYIGCRAPNCGCDRALIGLSSGAGSTTVKVSDVDIDYADAKIACQAYIERAGWDEMWCGGDPDRVAELVDQLVTHSAEVADQYLAGTVLRATCDQDTAEWSYRVAIR